MPPAELAWHEIPCAKRNAAAHLERAAELADSLVDSTSTQRELLERRIRLHDHYGRAFEQPPAATTDPWAAVPAPRATEPYVFGVCALCKGPIRGFGTPSAAIAQHGTGRCK